MYKEINIPIEKGVSIEKSKILNLFGTFFNNEFSFDFTDNQAEIQLAVLDYTLFQRTASNILLNGALNEESKKVVQGILNSISSIKSYGLKNGKRVYIDYNNERKVQNRKEKEERRQQFYYTKGNNFSKIENDIPIQYENQIVCGDSEYILSKLPNNCIDLVFTSPPYNFGLDYASTADDNHWETYFEKLFKIFSECIRVLKYGGRAIINVQPLFSDYIPTHHIVSNFFINKKMIWKGEILWEKNNYNCKYTAWGSWKSPSNPYLKYTWEFLEVFCKGELKKIGNSENADITDEEFKKWTVGKWSIAPERNMKEFDHPAMFPEELALRVIKLFSFKNDIVLDPFNGVGTTSAVANALKRRYLGIDISEKYCKIAKNRIANELF
ncbi:MAG: site-specific DNA-methyltransferase [Marinilabiliaceae bacterium]|nr:site-specific DNA-methyltransferase [Marinilabiliaceae bacterium]